MTKSLCSNCRNQMTGWDGGFFGLPFTCECRIYGETEGRKNCSEFKKRVTKSDLLNKIQSLEKENEQLKKECKIAVDEMVTDYKKLEKENEQLKGENERLRLELETHKHLLWSTREAEKKVNKLADSLADEVKKNGLLNEELNQLRIENMRLKKKRGE